MFVCMYTYRYTHFTCFLKNVSCVQLRRSQTIFESFLKMSLRRGSAAPLPCL